jgi:hypothetical protein
MELAGGSLIFLAGVLVFLIGAIVALYTRKGSGMDLHPYGHVHGGAPGAALPCEDFSGSDRTPSTEQQIVARWTRAPENEASLRAEAAARNRRERSAQRPARKGMRIPSPVPRLR